MPDAPADLGAPHDRGWRRADVDAVARWRDSGAEWLTAPGVAVPDGLVAEVAGLVAHLDERIPDPAARLVEVAGSAGVGLLAERAATIGLGPSSTTSCGGGTRLLRGLDDWLAVTLARDDDVDMVPAWLEVDVPPPGEHWALVAAAVAQRSCAELVERAAVLGLACAAVAERERSPGGASDVTVRRTGRRHAGTADGCLVVSLASLWAGPLAADVLARLGARVITVESSERPDGARATQAFFESLHGRSESVVLSFRDEVGRRRLAELLARADVVVEGSRPRALEQLGVDAGATVSSSGGVWISITGHGRGDAGHRIGFGDDAAAAGGLVGYVDGAPRFVADAVADPLAGLTAAAATVDLLETGISGVVDVPLAGVAAGCAGGSGLAPSGAPARPRRRSDPGRPLPLGRDTTRVLSDLGIG